MFRIVIVRGSMISHLLHCICLSFMFISLSADYSFSFCKQTGLYCIFVLNGHIIIDSAEIQLFSVKRTSQTKFIPVLFLNLVQPANRSLWNCQRSRYLEEEKTIFCQIWSILINAKKSSPNSTKHQWFFPKFPGLSRRKYSIDTRGFGGVWSHWIIAGFFSEPDYYRIL